MLLEEFKKLVEKFIPAEEIERYETDFEPAYMAAETVSKDEFCKILKDETTRRVIEAVSHDLISQQMQIKEITALSEKFKQERNQLADKNSVLRGYLERISAQVDRALSK